MKVEEEASASEERPSSPGGTVSGGIGKRQRFESSKIQTSARHAPSPIAAHPPGTLPPASHRLRLEI